MKRIVIGVAALTLALAGCSAPDSDGSSAGEQAESSTTGERQAADADSKTGSETEFLAEYDLAGLDAADAIDRLDRLPVRQRPAELMASVQPDELVLTDGTSETALALPEGKRYVSIAPFEQQTHECFYHSLTTCLGEMSGEAVDVTITDSATGKTVIEESTKTFDNGFIGFWVPADITGTIEITADGKTGSTEFSTKGDGATCVTDLKLE